MGLFQQCGSGGHWAIAWDLLHQSYYDVTTLHQLRGRAGWQVGEQDALGVRGTWSMNQSQSARVADTTVELSPIDQAAAFWLHEWTSGARTECWLGVADGHGEVVHVFPHTSRVSPAPLFGTALHVPLNDRLAIYGEGNFILPADSGTVDAYLGVVYYLGRSKSDSRQSFAPPMDAAGNTSFAVDLRR